MSTSPLPPDAAERDAARRATLGEIDDALHDGDVVFVTRGVSDEERAATIAVLARAREEETQRLRRIERQEREPWARSQRVPEGIGELLIEG